MSHNTAARSAGTGLGAYHYRRHQPEHTLLYQIIERYYPAFTAHLADQGTALPGYVQREFDDYLKCGRLEHGFLRVRCDTCHAEHLVAFSCKRRGFCHASDQKSRVHQEDCPSRRSHADPAFWVRAQPEYPFPHAVPRRGVRRSSRWIRPVLVGEGADQRGTHATGQGALPAQDALP